MATTEPARVCESCKEACATLADTFYVEWPNAPTIAARIRALPSPSPGGDPGVLVEALERIGQRSLTLKHLAEPYCDTCLRLIKDCDGAVAADRCPGRIARAALESWRRSSPERTAVRPAREIAHELTSQILGTLPGRCTDEEEPDDVHSVTCDKLTAALEADRRNR
jgi:hypothetical protein